MDIFSILAGKKYKNLLIGKIGANLAWIISGNVISGIMTFLISVYLARTLLVEKFGQISYAQTIVQYATFFVELGLTTFGVRELAKNKGELNKLFSNIISFRLISSVITFAAFSLLIMLSSFPGDMKILIILSSLMLFVTALSPDWVFQGLQQMRVMGFYIAGIAVLQFLFFIILIKNPDDVLMVPLLKFVSTMFCISALFFMLRRKIKIVLPDFKTVTIYLRSSIVLLLISMVAQIYHGSDIIFIGLMRTTSEVGWYAVAFKFVSMGIMALGFMNLVVFPAMADLYATDKKEFFGLIKKYFTALVVAGIAIIAVSFIFKTKLIIFLYGLEYEQAIAPFSILMIGFALLLIGSPCANAMVIAGLERMLLWQVIGCAVVNVFFNLVFIYKIGIRGAALSYMITQVVGFLLVSSSYYKEIYLKERPHLLA